MKKIFTAIGLGVACGATTLAIIKIINKHKAAKVNNQGCEKFDEPTEDDVNSTSEQVQSISTATAITTLDAIPSYQLSQAIDAFINTYQKRT